MDIQEISKRINDNAHVKGFWDNGIDIPEKLMLIVSELSEAMEADRINKFMPHYSKISAINGWTGDDDFTESFKKYAKDTFEDELADAAIRIFDLAFQMGFDLSAHIEAKTRFNEMRPHMHGGKKY